MKFVLLLFFLVSEVVGVKILEQNVGILTSKFACGANCKGSMCLVEQEVALSQNIKKNGPFDLIFLCEVMDSRDCPKTTPHPFTDDNSVCCCDKYPDQQQIDRLVSSEYTKLCDGHRSCLAIHSKYGNVSSTCSPVGSTCMDGMEYQKLPNCSNIEVADSGISFVDILEYETETEIRVILYHPIAYQGCFVEECFFEYFQAMNRLFEGAKNGRILIAGDFNFDHIRLLNLVQMEAFEYFLNITKKYNIQFFNTFFNGRKDQYYHFEDSDSDSDSNLPIPTEVGLFTLDWIGSNYYEFGKCINLNKMKERMDYPVLSFDHRGQICELSGSEQKGFDYFIEPPSTRTVDLAEQQLLFMNQNQLPSIQDVLGSFVEYSKIFLKDAYDSNVFHILKNNFDFWYNMTNLWIGFPSGMPILNQFAISSHSFYFWISPDWTTEINGTIDLNFLIQSSSNNFHHEYGTIEAKLVIESIEICPTFCNDIFEPVCFKKKPKKQKPDFCPSNSTCPSKYNVTTENYMQITNLELRFNRKKSQIDITNLSTAEEWIKKLVEYICKELKDLVLSEIENSLVSYAKGKVFLVNV